LVAKVNTVRRDTRAKQPQLTGTSIVEMPFPRELLSPVPITIRELKDYPKRFNVSPEFQRDNVWSTKNRQALVDSIFLGDPIPPFEGYERVDAETGDVVYDISDGHQRMTALLMFLNGGFKTWSAAQKMQAEPNSGDPICPNKFFHELPLDIQNYFLKYRLQIDLLRDRQASEKAIRFLRRQNQVPLSAAEKLHAYASKAKAAAQHIATHSFWSDFFTGKTNREQVYFGSLQLIAMELTKDGILTLDSHDLYHGLAAGKRDKEITDTLVDAVIARLDVVAHIFHGVKFSIRSTVIPMYQAVQRIERTKYTIRQEDKGILAPWMTSLILESRAISRVPSFSIPLQKMVKKSSQEAFWKVNHPRIMALLKDSKRNDASGSEVDAED